MLIFAECTKQILKVIKSEKIITLWLLNSKKVSQQREKLNLGGEKSSSPKLFRNFRYLRETINEILCLEYYKTKKPVILFAKL